MDAAEPLLMKILFDSLELKHHHMLLRAAGGLLLLGICRQAIGGVLNWLIWHVQIGVNLNVQKAMVERLHSLPLSFFREENAGGIITKMNRAIGGYVGALSEITTKILPNIIYLLFSLIAMSLLDWRLFLVALIFAPLPSLIGVWAATEQTQREKTLLVRWAQVYSRFYEVLSAIAVVKSFTREREEMQHFVDDVKDANRVVIAIARALLKDPPILILDEATSALDIECELQVQEAINRLMRGRTAFVIAHRLQTVVNADRIFVLRDGKIVAMGSHNELLRASSYYASLVKKQTHGWGKPEMNLDGVGQFSAG